jgi:hypothetical protein
LASFVTRTGGQKKKNILRQKELALRGDIRRQVSTEKLHRSAERVRSAQLGVIKALIYEAQPARSEDEERAKGVLLNLDAANERWETISVHEIIELYSDEAAEAVIVDRKRWWDFRPR